MDGTILPKGCISIATAVDTKVDQYCDLIGVAVGFRTPVATRGTDWMVTITLCDRSRALPETSLTIRIFRPDMELLPNIKSNSDLILVRRIKIVRLQGDILAMSTFDTSWAIFHTPTHPKGVPLIVTYPANLRVKPDELACFQALRLWWKSRRESFVSKGAAPGTCQSSQLMGSQRRKLGLIRDMQFGSFYDLAGVVVKTFPGNGNYTVYLTDYTKNHMLHSYEWGGSRRIGAGGDDDDFDYSGRGRGIENSDWPGPWGQYTLQVTLWDVHAVAANRMLYVGAHVSLQNVRAKRNGDGKLEGTLSGDRKFPDKVLVSLIKNMDDPRVKQIAIRSKEYKRRFESDRLRYEEEMTARLEEAQKKERGKLERKHEGNTNVRAIKANQPITPISQIAEPKGIDGSFANRLYKTYCRVVDYLPRRLEDFSVLDEEETQWVWRFALLVEGDDGGTLRVIVEGEDAEFLLRARAVDLHSDGQALGVLREKLFILWGNLEEVKNRQAEAKTPKKVVNSMAKPPSKPSHGKRKRHRPPRNNNRPEQIANKQPRYDELGRTSKEGHGGEEEGESFDEKEQVEDSQSTGKMFEACLKEYGVPKPDGEWKRLHKLTGTVIV